jgi:hypothetical protein
MLLGQVKEGSAMEQDEFEEQVKRSEEESREVIRASRKLDRLSEEEKLIEVWKVLEALTVSMDRMGHYWLWQGEEAAKQALHQYMDPALFNRIAQARYLITAVLEARNPRMRRRLDELAEKEDDIPYWNGPQT